MRNENGIAFCHNGLGVQFYKQKNYSKAEEYLNKSLVLKRKTGNKKAIISGHLGLASLYMDLKNYSLASENNEQALTLSSDLNVKDYLCEALINKGMISHLQNKLAEAHDCFSKAKAIAEELKNSALLAKIDVETGRLYEDQKENDKALVSLTNGVAHARQSNNLDFEQSAHRHLADLYYSTGKYKEAFEEYRLFHSLYDSLEGSSVKMQLFDMEAKYETHKKESEIVLLRKDQQLQASALRQKATFQTAIFVTFALIAIIAILLFSWYRHIVKTKRHLEIEGIRNHIAQDLHDDIGSSLSSINIISKMGALNQVNENNHGSFAQIEDQSGKMLSQMADIIWSINPGNDTLDEVLLHMKEFAAEILEPANITYQFKETGKVGNVKISAAVRKNLFLIFKEVLNNAMKYSSCTEVSIDLTVDQSRLTLDIRDNGEGFDMHKVILGNGLNNMQARARAIDGTLTIKAVEQGGTHISISVNIA